MFYKFVIMIFITAICIPTEASVLQSHGNVIAPYASTYNAHTIEHTIAYPLLLQAAPSPATIFDFIKPTMPSLASVSPPTPSSNQISITTTSIENIKCVDPPSNAISAVSLSFNELPKIGFAAIPFSAPYFTSFPYYF
uniref:Uncharacterized protein n=1 Tax=Glossina brevipalpis TaxID=37001 RepID=A0A1A9X0L9_9MUSC